MNITNSDSHSICFDRSMSGVSRKINSRRRLAAITFLNNISLDGTHRDTNLCELTFNLRLNKSTDCSLLVDHSDVLSRAVPVLVQSQTPVGTSEDVIINEHAGSFSYHCDSSAKKANRRQSEHIVQGSIDRLESILHSKSKDRVHRFVSEAKARICNLSQKRRLSHQQSVESYGLPTGTSTESLVVGACRSRKPSLCPSEVSFPSSVEVKFLKTYKDHKNKAERMVLISGKKSPFVLFSVLPYSRLPTSTRVEAKTDGSRRRHPPSIKQLAVISDGPDPLDMLGLLGIEKALEGQDISYGELLAPSYLSKKRGYCSLQGTGDTFRFPYYVRPTSYSVDYAEKIESRRNFKLSKTLNKYQRIEDFLQYRTCYNPNLLDDPELVAGKHSTLLVFPSYITSVIDYVKPSDLKKDLNEKFRERFPNIQLSLSKLRSLKKEMYKIARIECNVDLSIVAQAFVYFEKLILKNLVNKNNRKHCAGACLLLSAKLNDVRGPDLRNLLEKIEYIYRINRKDLIGLEFGVLVALEFTLHLNTAEILPHYQRLVYES